LKDISVFHAIKALSYAELPKSYKLYWLVKIFYIKDFLFLLVITII